MTFASMRYVAIEIETVYEILIVFVDILVGCHFAVCANNSTISRTL